MRIKIKNKPFRTKFKFGFSRKKRMWVIKKKKRFWYKTIFESEDHELYTKVLNEYIK